VRSVAPGRPILATTVSETTSSITPTPDAGPDAEQRAPEAAWLASGRRWLSTVAALPIFTKVMIGNAGVVIFGAVVGTYVTAHTVRYEPSGTPLELVFVFAAIGALLSVAVNWIVLKLALRPLDGITRTVEEVRKGNLRARAERDPLGGAPADRS
jgi:hypothetical protein